MQAKFKAMGVTLSEEESKKLMELSFDLRKKVEFSLEAVSEEADKAVVKVSMRGIDKQEFGNLFVSKIEEKISTLQLNENVTQDEMIKSMIPHMISALDESIKECSLIKEPVVFEVECKLNKDKNIWEVDTNKLLHQLEIGFINGK